MYNKIQYNSRYHLANQFAMASDKHATSMSITGNAEFRINKGKQSLVALLTQASFLKSLHGYAGDNNHQKRGKKKMANRTNGLRIASKPISNKRAILCIINKYTS